MAAGNWPDSDAPPRFRVMAERLGGADANFPNGVPWSLVAPHERQAQANHAQTLRRLHERGGLSARELYYLSRGEKWNWRAPVDYATAVAYVGAALAKHEEAAA